MNIPFNKPFIAGNELAYISEAVKSGKISGDGIFTKKCHAYFEEQLGFNKVLLTTSCTDALEMAAILLDIKPGDEVIAPSYTFVSTVNAFVLRGAKIVFADSNSENPNINPEHIESLISSKTKVIIPVHYAGIACDMDKIMAIAAKHNIYVVEDAAQAIDSFYKSKPLGTIGHLAAFSFHETKNIIAGEGGLLSINHKPFAERAEIIREKGTNRSKFFRGEVDKYNWVDIGSSFLPSEIISAFLFAQLENLKTIQTKRKAIWNRYNNNLQNLAQSGQFRLPYIPDFATNNAHMFYVLTKDLEERNRFLAFLKQKGIYSVFHYISLHNSPFQQSQHSESVNQNLPYSDFYTDTLVRLPLFYELTENEVDQICEAIHQFFKQ